MDGTYKNLVQELFSIHDHIVSDFVTVASNINIQAESQDIRLVSLSKIAQAIRGSSYLINALNFVAESTPVGTGMEEWMTDILHQFSKNRTDFKRMNQVIENVQRSYLITDILFAIEPTLKLIAKNINPSVQDKYFYFVKELRDRHVINEQEKNILIGFSYIRNSQHSNGIHNINFNLSFQINDQEFIFQKGERVLCASWQHIVVILKEVIKIFQKIITSDDSVNIGYQEDQYATETLDEIL